jgi:hypothetical protein
VEHAHNSFKSFLFNEGGWLHPATKCKRFWDNVRNELLYALYPYDRTVRGVTTKRPTTLLSLHQVWFTWFFWFL